MQYKITPILVNNEQTIPLKEDEYKRIVSARQNVFEFLKIEENFVYLIENYRDLEIDVLTNIFRNTTCIERPWTEIVSDIHLFNRRIINLLTTSRLYLDHIPHHLNNIFSDNESITAEFKSNLSLEYDSSFSYRLLEALRNYVQYRDLPLSGIYRGMQSLDNSNGMRLLENSMEFNIDKSQLINDNKFKRSISEELQDYDDRIDLRPMIREYIECISIVHDKLRSKINLMFNKEASIINDSISLYSNGEEKLESALHIVK